MIFVYNFLNKRTLIKNSITISKQCKREFVSDMQRASCASVSIIRVLKVGGAVGHAGYPLHVCRGEEFGAVDRYRTSGTLPIQ